MRYLFVDQKNDEKKKNCVQNQMDEIVTEKSGKKKVGKRGKANAGWDGRSKKRPKRETRGKGK
jgi:hypothetical protein